MAARQKEAGRSISGRNFSARRIFLFLCYPQHDFPSPFSVPLRVTKKETVMEISSTCGYFPRQVFDKGVTVVLNEGSVPESFLPPPPPLMWLPPCPVRQLVEFTVLAGSMRNQARLIEGTKNGYCFFRMTNQTSLSSQMSRDDRRDRRRRRIPRTQTTSDVAKWWHSQDLPESTSRW